MMTEPRAPREGAAPPGASLQLPEAARFSCSGCGDCCRQYPVPLSAADHARLEALDWRSLLAEPERGFARRLRLRAGLVAQVLRQEADGACVFLDAENHCRIHSRYGEAAKPVACRAFPFSFVTVPGADELRNHVAVEFFCKSVASGSGAPIATQRAALAALRPELESAFPMPLTARELELDPALRYPTDRIDWIIDLLTQEVADETLALSKRLLILTRFLALLVSSRFPNISDPKRSDLVTTLLKGTRNQVRKEQVQPPAASPSFPEHLLFRQLLAFQTLDHGRAVGFAPSRVVHALRWLFGRGTIRLPGTTRPLSVERVRAEAPSLSMDDPVASDTISRYLKVQLQSRRILATGFARRSLSCSLGLLLRQVPAILLYSRAACLARGGAAVEADDTVAALRLVDLSFGQFLGGNNIFARTRERLLRDLNGPWNHLAWCGEKAP